MMQRIWWSAVLAVPLMASSAQAQQYFNNHTLPPAHLDGGITLNFNLFAGGGQTQLGPWYLYWPYNAHFVMPPPLGPSMPGPVFQTLPPSMMGQPPMGAPPSWTPPAPTPIPPTPNGNVQNNTGLRPVGYYYYGQAPAYWYGR
jgi:hypothetical protein